MLIKVENAQTKKYSLQQLLQENPNVSFPSNPPLELLAEWGVFELNLMPQPVVDHTKTVTEGNPYLDNGKWTQNWVVADATTEEINKRKIELAMSVREKRNLLLSTSDWTQLPDSPVDRQSWSIYRQELRDITSQPTFPFVVIWPNQPFTD
jgi:hypothetical protein